MFLPKNIKSPCSISTHLFQGVWMGLITGSGCFSRVIGPIFVVYIYTHYGTIWTFSSTAVMMAVSMIWLHIFSRRLERACKTKPSAGNQSTLRHELNTVDS